MAVNVRVPTCSLRPPLLQTDSINLLSNSASTLYIVSKGAAFRAFLGRRGGPASGSARGSHDARRFLAHAEVAAAGSGCDRNRL